MAKGAILIGYGSLPTKADVEDAIKSGWIKNADIVSTTSFPAGTEPNGDLHFMTYLIMKREKGWDDPGDLQSMKITTADKRVIYSVYPSEGVDTLRTTPQSTHQQTMSTKWWEIGRKQSDNDSNSQQPFQSFSSFDAAQVGEEMGEMYFQCPNCGAYERVNDIGKMMLKSDPNYFTSIDCIKCKYTYNASITTRLCHTTRFRLILRDFAFTALRSVSVRLRTGSFAVRTIGGMISLLTIVQDERKIGSAAGLVFNGGGDQLTGLRSGEGRAFF